MVSAANDTRSSSCPHIPFPQRAAPLIGRNASQGAHVSPARQRSRERCEQVKAIDAEGAVSTAPTDCRSASANLGSRAAQDEHRIPCALSKIHTKAEADPASCPSAAHNSSCAFTSANDSMLLGDNAADTLPAIALPVPQQRLPVSSCSSYKAGHSCVVEGNLHLGSAAVPPSGSADSVTDANDPEIRGLSHRCSTPTTLASLAGLRVHVSATSEPQTAMPFASLTSGLSPVIRATECLPLEQRSDVPGCCRSGGTAFRSIARAGIPKTAALPIAVAAPAPHPPSEDEGGGRIRDTAQPLLLPTSARAIDFAVSHAAPPRRSVGTLALPDSVARAGGDARFPSQSDATVSNALNRVPARVQAMLMLEAASAPLSRESPSCTLTSETGGTHDFAPVLPDLPIDGEAFSHDPRPRGAVWEASSAGNAEAVAAALLAGGSTEEAEAVSCRSLWVL